MMELPLSLKKSRKAYFIEYSCGFILLLILLVIKLKGWNAPQTMIYYIGGIGIFAIGYAEFARSITRYKITESKIIIAHGFIKQDKKNVYYQPLGYVIDLNVKQKHLQRILNYGTVYLKAGGESSFEIKDVDRPQRVLELIEQLIEENRLTNINKTQVTA